jgi:hypothetical protein
MLDMVDNIVLSCSIWGPGLKNYPIIFTMPQEPSPSTGEGLGGGDHPPLDPLPSREGKLVVGRTIDPSLSE